MALDRLARCWPEQNGGTIQDMNTTTLRRFRNTLSGLVAEDRPAYKRLDVSPARYDDGSWLEPRR
jgi:hypothetical protein